MDKDTFQRFHTMYVVQSTGCWTWQGAKVGKGYGVMGVSSGSRLAHRLSYEHFVGPIPAKFTIDHLCRNKACVNPEHLEAVTNKVNNLRGTSSSAQNARKTQCSMGHDYTPENTYTDKAGHRHCRTCHRLREHQRKVMMRKAV